MSEFLTVDQILNAPDVQEEAVEVPEWGGKVLVRTFTKKRQQELLDAASVTVIEGGKPVKKRDEEKLEILMFVEGVVNPKFSPEHAAALAEKAAAPFDRVMKAILRLNGLTQEAAQEAEKSDPAQS